MNLQCISENISVVVFHILYIDIVLTRLICVSNQIRLFL